MLTLEGTAAYLEFCASIGNLTAKFILQNGRRFYMSDATFKGPRMAAQMCYRNAAEMAFGDPGYIYVEGMISVYGIPIFHAWNIDHNGALSDPTIDNNDGRIGDYYGVVFNTDYVRRSVYKNNRYGLFDYMYARKTLPDLLAGRTKNALFDFDNVQEPAT